MTGRTPWLVFANRINETMADDLPSALARQAVRQASRKVWLLRSGDVLVTPVEISADFLHYACGVLGVPPASVITLTVPGAHTLPLADAVERSGLTTELEALAADRPGLRILPYAVDRPTVRLAGALGLPLHPYGNAPVGNRTLDAVDRLNSKDGFRAAATALGLPIPEGVVCTDGEQLRDAVRAMTSRVDAVLKPARSANGFALTTLPRGTWRRVRPLLEQHLADTCAPCGTWVVEERVTGATDVSAQAHVHHDGTRVRFDGTMRMTPGGFASHGYQSPLQAPARVRDTLADMALRLGEHLRGSGYLGPFSLDAVLTPRGEIFCLESNVRRTGTTTPHTLVRHLTATGPRHGGDIVWLYDSGLPTPSSPRSLAEALDRLAQAGLAHEPGRDQQVVILNDPAGSGAWSYLALAPDLSRLHHIEQQTCRTLALRQASARLAEPGRPLPVSCAGRRPSSRCRGRGGPSPRWRRRGRRCR